MTSKKQAVKDLLDGLDIAYRWVDHEPVYTVEEAAALVEDKYPIKNLLLKEKKGHYYLVIMSGATSLDIKNLAGRLASKRLSFASKEDMERLLNVTPGAVSLFGLMNDNDNQVQLVIEAKLLEVDELGFHPNENTSTVFMSPDDIDKIFIGISHSAVIMSDID